MYHFDAWFPGVCFLIGLAVGGIIMHYEKRDLVNRLKKQTMHFVELITDLVVKNMKLHSAFKRMVEINKNLIKRG